MCERKGVDILEENQTPDFLVYCVGAYSAEVAFYIARHTVNKHIRFVSPSKA